MAAAAPGTWASLVPLGIFALLNYCGVSAGTILIVMIFAAAAASEVCICFADAAITATGQNDPHEVVMDEVAGQAVTYLTIGSVIIGQLWVAAIMGFLLFRFFDIVKPWPIKEIEKVPRGWGILCDDLAAGVYAGGMLIVFYEIGIIGYLGKFL